MKQTTKILKENNENFYVFDGIDDKNNEKVYAISKKDIAKLSDKGLRTKYAQLMCIIEPCLPCCKVMFQGIERPCKGCFVAN